MAALAAYRGVLRATRVAFRGDHRILISAREKVRDSFNHDSTLAPGSPEAAQRIQHAQEVATFLRQNLVQGERVEGAGAADGQDEGRYKLNVHDETERGDNETNRMPKKEAGSLAGVKAQSFRSSVK